ncbi:MAG: hypothetical protein RLZZ494_2340 [Pseudomonadota bacterium]|jgi:peptidoglycan-associated lipoprotein|nr:peptidoglycan-associated lipoprotein Pal [Vitreoscilla filiformis]
MKSLKSVLLLTAASALFAGCTNVPLNEPAPVTTLAPAAPAVADAAPAVISTVQQAVAPKPAHLDPTSRISLERSIYFEYDQFTIRSADTGLVELHGKYLVANPNVSIKIEGNADERGSKEYNLALGQKRAEAVLRALKTFGVKDSQAEPVSFGEEKPKSTGQGEAAWAQNRRADLVYPAK